MTTREAVPSQSHTDHCIICDEEISCHNPNDPQDCLFSSAVCDSCSDEFQDLIPSGREDEFQDGYAGDDVPLDYNLAVEDVGSSQDEPDPDYFDVTIRGEQGGNEMRFEDEPPIRTAPESQKPLKKKKPGSRRKKN